jgi:transposase-like protein
MDEWQFIAERKIRQAMEEGAFDCLDGTGEPLDLNENPFEDPSLRLAHRLLRNNGFAPEWIEESRDIETEARWLREHRGIPAEEMQSRIQALNRKIELFNLKAPSMSLHKRPFTLEN